MSCSAERTGCVACSSSRVRRIGVCGTLSSASTVTTELAAATANAVDGAGRRHDRPRDGRPDRLPDGGPHHALEPVDRLQLRLGHQGRQPRGVGGVVEGHPHPRREGDPREQPETAQAHRRQQRDQPHAHDLDERHGHEDEALRHAVGHHPGHEGGQQHTDGARGGDERQLGRAAPEPDDLPDQRDHPHPGGERARGQRHGEPAVGRGAEGRERPGQPPADLLVADRVAQRVGERVGHRSSM